MPENAPMPRCFTVAGMTIVSVTLMRLANAPSPMNSSDVFSKPSARIWTSEMNAEPSTRLSECGRLTVVKCAHPPKARTPMTSSPSGSETSLSSSMLKNASSPMLSTLPGTVTFVMLLQNSNAPSEMLVSLAFSGILTDSRLVQLEKAYSPIDSTESGIAISQSSSNCWNANRSIFVSPAGNTTLSRA